jgi:hypothetical protein
VRCVREALAYSPTSHSRIDLALGLVALVAIALLDFPDQLVSLACQQIQVIVGELAPLLLRPPLELLPIPFNLIPIHVAPPFFSELDEESKKKTDIAISTVTDCSALNEHQFVPEHLRSLEDSV